MKNDVFVGKVTSFLTVGALFFVLGNLRNGNAQSNTTKTYYCDLEFHSQEEGKVPATILRNTRGRFPILFWVNDLVDDKAEKRCEKVSKNLQTKYEHGIIDKKYLKTDTVDNEPVICLVSNDEERCKDNIILKLKQETDSDHILNILTDYNYALRNDTGRLTDEIRFYRDGKIFFNLDLFIERAYLAD